MQSRLPLAVGFLVLVSCADADFAPYNLIDGLRVMAVQSEPPAIGPGVDATLTALVNLPHGEEAVYDWSWCPITRPRETGYACAVTAADLQAVIDEALGPGEASVPAFGLGSAETATLGAGPSAEPLRALCEGLLAAGASATSAAIDCDESFEVTVRLEVRTPADSVTAIKRVPIFFDAAQATNTNPTLGEVRAAGQGQGESATQPVEASGGTALLADATYSLWVDVPEASFESFADSPGALPRGEDLYLTWLVTAGETDETRTSFIDGEVGVDTLRQNAWTLPALSEVGSSATLFIVIRDERGGAGWTARDVQIREP